jgi:drug/metabolite transporter (DMT)-like permease
VQLQRRQALPLRHQTQSMTQPVLLKKVRCCAASLGFLLNLLAFAVIKLTGSLTQKVLGTVKNVLLVLFSVFFMGEQITLRQWIGYQVSLAGFVWYQQQKISAATASKSANGASPRKGASMLQRSPTQLKRMKAGP